MPELPDADYVVLASRVALGLDGGFAVAVPRRLGALDAAGAREPLLLSLDGQPVEAHAEQRQALVDAGLLDEASRSRNLFDELAADPSWLYAAGTPGARTPGVAYREIPDAAGRAIVSLPVFANDPEWHLHDAAVVVHGADGDRAVAGFPGLYIAWLEHIAAARRAAAGDPDRLFVIVCESRQIGETLVGWRDPRVRIVHTIHNSHLPAPHDDPDAPVEGLWRRWLATLDRYDAVLWPTAAQADDVARRFGYGDRFHVVPNPIELGGEPGPFSHRDGHLAVMVNRLAEQKRIDRAIRAWPRVAAAVPGARLDIYGDGPLRDDLQTLIDDLGLGDSVRLRGVTTNRDAVLDVAGVFLSTSAFEGQGLAIAEALARGVPVVATDVRYGPAETVGDAGVLVAPDDIDGLADAVIGLFQDDVRRAELSARAREAARAFAPEAVVPALVDALRAAVARG